jgi:hypothetical protein
VGEDRRHLSCIALLLERRKQRGEPLRADSKGFTAVPDDPDVSG